MEPGTVTGVLLRPCTDEDYFFVTFKAASTRVALLVDPMVSLKMLGSFKSPAFSVESNLVDLFYFGSTYLLVLVIF